MQEGEVRDDLLRAQARRLFAEAAELEQAGRREEAAGVYRRAARYGGPEVDLNLGSLLIGMGGACRAEGLRRLRQAVRAGEGAAAWNLALEHRRAGARRGYVFWMRQAARLGEADASAILEALERRDAAGWAGTMPVCRRLGTREVVRQLARFRAGEASADEVAAWAEEGLSLRSTLALDPRRRLDLALVLRELADPERRLTVQRATELAFRLG